MQHRNAGLIADPLFIGATRPSMLWGVTYSAAMLIAMCIMELFLLTKNLLILLLAAPTHSLHAALRSRCALFRFGPVVG
jgi:type IV secretion system protein VirB3